MCRTFCSFGLASSAALFLAGAPALAPALAEVPAPPAQTAEKIGDAAHFLMLPPDEQPGAYRNTDKLFATRTFKRGSVVYPLPAAAPLTEVPYRFAGKILGLEDFMQRNRVGGLLVLEDGHVRLERYALGNNDRSRWTSFSVGKSIVSTLVGSGREGRGHREHRGSGDQISAAAARFGL